MQENENFIRKRSRLILRTSFHHKGGENVPSLELFFMGDLKVLLKVELVLEE